MAASGFSLSVSAVLITAGVAASAFEPVAQAPELFGGYASCVFPRSPMASCMNPALIGLLESPCASLSASRPFGLRELDRVAAAGCAILDPFAAGGVLTASGNSSYSEWSLGFPLAWRASEGLLLGFAPSVHRLAIAGYGSAAGFSSGFGALCRPVRGVFVSTGLEGAFRTSLGDSGDPATPLCLSIGVGVRPVQNAGIAAAASRQEGLPVEASLSASFFPVDRLGLEISFVSSPARFSAAVCFDLSEIELALGYAEHPALSGTASAAITWGRPAFVPEPVLSESVTLPEAEGPHPVNINTAGADELCSLPGIGPARAEAIIRYREQNGPFRSVDRLADVPGISGTLVDSLRNDLRIE